MNPLLSNLQLQDIFIQKIFNEFREVLLNLKKENKINSQRKKILDLFFKYATPQLLAKPEINYRLFNLKNQLNEKDIDNLFFELILILLKLELKQIELKITNDINSPLIKGTIRPNHYIFSLENNKLILNDNQQINLANTYKDFYIGEFNLVKEDQVKENPNLDALFENYINIPQREKDTIETLTNTIIILEKISEIQISYSASNLLGSTFIQEENSQIFCDSLIHETMHTEFRIILSMFKLLKNNDDEIYFSAVTDKPRSLINCFLALHAFIPLEEYHLNTYHKTKDHKILYKLFSETLKNESLIYTLKKYGDFTKEGIKLMDALIIEHNNMTQYIQELSNKFQKIAKDAKYDVEKHKKDTLEKYPNCLC